MFRSEKYLASGDEIILQLLMVIFYSLSLQCLRNASQSQAPEVPGAGTEKEFSKQGLK